MILPLQFGVPGGPELVIVFLLLAVLLIPVVLLGLVVAVLLLRRSGDGSGEERRPPQREPARGDHGESDAAGRDRETDTDESVRRDPDSRPQ